MSVEAYGNIIGVIMTEDRVQHNEDGTVDIITTSFAKKTMGSGNIVLRIKEETFKSRVEPRIRLGIRVKINGFIKACVTKKGIPYTLVKVTAISRAKSKQEIPEEEIELEQAEQQQARLEVLQAKLEAFQKMKEKRAAKKAKLLELQEKQEKQVAWYHQLEEEDFEEVELDLVKVVEKEHLETSFTIKAKDRPIAVRKNENGEYELVVGIAAYARAKICNKKTVKVYKTDLTREEFVKKFYINERKNKKNLPQC